MNSRRQQVVDAVMAAFATVEAIATVAEWQTEPFAQEELPAVVVRDVLNDAPAPRRADWRTNNLQFVCDLLMPDDATPAQTRALVADIFAVLGEDTGLGGLCDEITPTREGMVTDETATWLRAARLEFTAWYDTPTWEL